MYANQNKQLHVILCWKVETSLNVGAQTFWTSVPISAEEAKMRTG